MILGRTFTEILFEGHTKLGKYAVLYLVVIDLPLQLLIIPTVITGEKTHRDFKSAGRYLSPTVIIATHIFTKGLLDKFIGVNRDLSCAH